VRDLFDRGAALPVVLRVQLVGHPEVEQAAQLWGGEVVAIELDHDPAPISIGLANRHRGVLPRASSLMGGSRCISPSVANSMSASRSCSEDGFGGSTSFRIWDVLRSDFAVRTARAFCFTSFSPMS